MGGDHGPSVVVPGVALAATEAPALRFLLHGDERAISAELAKHPSLKDRVEVRHAERVVAMDEKPAQALRRGKGTSMWSAIESVKSGEAQASVSAGNTGALMAISLLILRMSVDVERPCLVVGWPGVKGILVQWAKHIGATVIATAGSAEKAERATSLGADHVILYRDEDVAAQVREITGGAGVPVAYDSVGAATFEGTLKSLARRGLFVSFGNASGPVPPFAPARLQQSGSLFFTRPTMGDYLATTAELDESAAALFGVIASGAVKIDIGQTFKLEEAQRAHEALEGRETVGASLLIP